VLEKPEEKEKEKKKRQKGADPLQTLLLDFLGVGDDQIPLAFIGEGPESRLLAFLEPEVLLLRKVN